MRHGRGCHVMSLEASRATATADWYATRPVTSVTSACVADQSVGGQDLGPRVNKRFNRPTPGLGRPDRSSHVLENKQPAAAVACHRGRPKRRACLPYCMPVA